MVFLRAITPDDRKRMLDILTSDKVSQTYMLPVYDKREDAEPLFCRLMNLCKGKEDYVRGIATADGLVGFLNHTDIQGTQIELGYVIHPDFHGQGFMTQGLLLAIEELFALGYRAIITGAFSDNTASIRVMEKCGMTRLSKSDHIEYRGKTHTCVYYQKIQE